MKYSEGLAQVLPRVAEKGTFQSSYTGLYDMTPDQHPVIDEFSADGYEGLYCLVGLSGHGFKLAPEFGRTMAALLTGRRPSEYDVSIFRRTRFKEGKLFTSKYPLSTVA